jgi:DNA-binding transcriptional LysR family regulator
MELRHMRYFVAVAEERSFTRAAARLHLAQPSLSRQIRDLENELAVPLLHRGKGGLTLTDAGKEYLAQARRILADSDAAVRVAQAAGRSEQRQLLIGTIEPLMSSGLLAAILKNFASLHPDVRVDLRELFSVDQLRLIAGAELDAGFVYRPPKDPSVFDGFVVLENHHVAAFPSAYRLARKNKILLKDLAGESFVQFSRHLWPERVDAISRKCVEAGFTMRIVQEAQRLHTLLEFVAQGICVAILPDPLSHDSDRVVFKKLEDFDLAANLQLVWLRENDSRLLKEFVAAARRSKRSGGASVCL